MFDNSRLFDYFPNVILPAIFDTLKILLLSGVVTIIVGMLLGCILFLTSYNGLSPNKLVYLILGRVTDIVRSFPTMILIVALAPITRIVVGTMIGVRSAVFAISIGCIPFAARMTENALQSVDKETIIAAQSFGATNRQIMLKILLIEALPQIVDNFTIMVINMLNMSAMAGAIGAGGLGAVALTYGYQQFDYGVMYFTVLILMVFVFMIQIFGKYLKIYLMKEK